MEPATAVIMRGGKTAASLAAPHLFWLYKPYVALTLENASVLSPHSLNQLTDATAAKKKHCCRFRSVLKVAICQGPGCSQRTQGCCHHSKYKIIPAIYPLLGNRAVVGSTLWGPATLIL